MRRALVLAALVLALWVPRALALDRFATFDEHLWLSRSANFICALAQGDYRNTFQREHPGVTTMWAGTLGLLWRAPGYTSGCEQVGKREHEQVLREAGYDPVALLAAGRLFVVLGISAALVLGYLYARRLVGELPAIVGFLLVAFDPFHLAHSRLLHVDGLLASLMFLSALAWMCFVRERRMSALVVSGIAAGLSFLTKSAALFLVPYAGLLTLMQVWTDRKSTRVGALAWRAGWTLALWGAVGACVFLALWPAMWADPVGTFTQVLDLAQDYSTRGHPNPVFFNRVLYEDGSLDASFVHFYPLSYLWRGTPTVLVGLVLAFAALLMRRGTEAATRRVTIDLLLYVLFFGVMINLSAKKFDRYLLPAYGPLDLVAGMGWVAALRWLGGRRFGYLSRRALSAVLVIAIAVQITVALRTYPYYLSYFNPLMGGSQKASQVLMVGWGEGLDRAARYLNDKPNSDELYVMSWYYPGCFSYFFKGISRDLPYQGWEDIHFQEALNADYAVVYYAHQLQRYAPKQLLDYLLPQAYERAIWINGLEYVRIYEMDYDIRADPAYVPADVRLGERIRLEGYSVDRRRVPPGESLVVSLSWLAEGMPGDRFKVFVHVLNGDGLLVAQHDGEPVAWMTHTDDWEAGEQFTDRHGVTLSPDLPPGEYTITVGMYGPTGERLAITRGGESLGDAFRLGKVTVGPL